jgi:two-component system, OmpR family, sensor kinase
VSAISIRSRITIGSAIVALVVIAISVFAIRINVESILHSSNVSLATTDLASFEKDLSANPGETVDPPGAGVLVLVRAPDGRVAVDTLPDDVRRAVDRRAPGNEDFSASEDGTRYVVVAQTVRTRSGTWGLWAARSSASSDLALRGLDQILLIGGTLVLLAFAGASWLLATFSLRPVTAMRRRAETLSGAGDDERLPVGQARDEIAALASTLNDFLDRVTASTEREKRMVSDAAHELRTPLSALRTQLELAHDDFGDADALELEILGAESSVVRLTALANGLLELSRLEGRTVGAGPTTAAVLIDESMGSVDRARMLALSKSVDVAFDVGDFDEAARYAIEPDAFARMLDNLLSNAVAAVGVEGAVALSVRPTATGLQVEVRDDGPGIPQGFLAIAFDRFSRPDESRSAAAGGSGLGLALVRAIAETAGGTAELANAERGAVATIRIPNM